jgi:hypothetical protein
MATETAILKIKAERLGTVKEVKQLLTDFENAYNSVYAFDFIVDTLSNDQDRKLRLLDERFHNWRKYWKELSMRKDFPYDPFMFELFWNRHLHRSDENTLNLLDLQSKIDIDKIVLPADSLVISKVNIQSPGFWEFLGAANPLTFIREFIKDLSYRNRQEKEQGEWKILQERIATLKQLGYSDIEIRQIVSLMVTKPLKIIGNHKASGLIDGLEE